MHRADFTGTTQVFRFTLAQHYRSRSTIISLIIFLLIALAMPPIMTIIQGPSLRSTAFAPRMELAPVEEESTQLPAYALVDETDLAIRSYLPDALSVDAAPSDALFVYVYPDGDGYEIQLQGSDDAAILEYLAEHVRSGLERARCAALGVTEAQYERLSTPFAIVSETLDDATGDDARSSLDFDTHFAVSYGYSILVMMICMLSSSYIIRAVIEEKASKLVELFMVSVKPLALIVGKILAVMSWIFIGLVGIVGCLLLSNALTRQWIGSTPLDGIMGVLNVFENVNAGLILVILISLLLSYATFSLLSGMAGARCSVMEDMQGANMSIVLLVMAGYLMGVVQTTFDGHAAMLIFSLIPISGLFCAPINYALSGITFFELILSWAVQLLVIGLLMVIMVRVYHYLIFYRGERMKLRRVLALAKGGTRE